MANSISKERLSGIKLLSFPWNNPTYFENDKVSISTQELKTRKFTLRWHQWKTIQSTILNLYSSRPIIALLCLIRGRVFIRMPHRKEQPFNEFGFDLSYFPLGWSPVRVDPGEYAMLIIETDPDYLEDMGVMDYSVRELLNSLHEGQGLVKSVGQVPMNFIARNHLNELLNDQYKKEDTVLNIHLSIVGLLKEYIEATMRQKDSMNPSNISYKAKMTAIRDEILHAPHIQKQRLRQIAQRHGISMTVLKKNFKILFGVTPAAFIRKQALHKAYHLILHTKKTIDDISEEVGYGYRINFDRAFLKQFGYLPTSLRQEKNNPGSNH